VSIEFVCHNCGQELKVHEQAVGRRVRCPGCDTLLVVPEPAEIEAEEQESAELPAEPSPIEAPVEEVEQPIAREQPPAPQGTSDAARKSPQELPFAAAAPPPNVTPPPISAPVMPKRQPLAQSQAKPKTVDDPPLILPPQDHPEDLIDMTAMVDIVFFLLIFFMVTSLQALEAVMNLPTPQSAEGGAASSRSVADLENDPSFITVRIEDDDSIWVEDTQVFNDQELLVRLRNAKGSVGSRSLLVIGDADASHGSAVRVFDAGAGAGVNGISLVVQEKGEGR
jgi:biopolymer transport protein ExbD